MGYRSLNYLESIAVFMIFLVLSLPFYVADVHAASSVSQITITGQDQLDNSVVRQQDYLTVSARIQVDDDDLVTPNQVAFGTSEFNNCVDFDGTSYACTYQDQQVRNIGAGAKSGIVYAENDEGDQVASAAKAYYADTIPPAVSMFTVEEDLENQQVTLSFTASDTADNNAPPTACAGVMGLTFYADNIPVYNVQGDGSCTFSDSVTVPSNTFAANIGEVEICADAVDLFDQKGAQKCNNFVYDAGSPEFIPESLEIVEDNDQLFYIGVDIERVVDVSISFVDDSLVAIPQLDVAADFSSVAGNSFANKKPTLCNFANNVNSCTWKNVPVMFKSFENEEDYQDTVVTFNAEDKKGNVGEITLDLGSYLLIDSNPPQVSEIVSIYQDPNDGMHYLGSGMNQIIAFITEGESGMKKEEVFLSVSGVSLEGAGTNPTECIFGVGCYWNYTGASGTDGKQVDIKLNPQSVDAAGNQIEGALVKEMYFDNSIPQILDVNVSTESGAICSWSNDGSGNCHNESSFRSDDMLSIIMTVSEPTSTPYLTMNASSFAEIDELLPGMCEERWDEDADSFDEDGGLGIWDCYFDTVGPVFTSQGNMRLIASDSAGNNETINMPIRIYKSTKTDMFSSIKILDAQPDEFSRETTPFVEQSAYIRARLFPSSQYMNAEARSFELMGCEDSEGLGFFVDASEFYVEADGRTKWFSITHGRIPVDEHTNGDDEYLSEMDMDCYFSVVGASGQRLSEVQMLNASYEVKFYDLPLGALDEGLQEKVDEYRDSVNSYFQVLKVMKIITSLISGICSIWFTLTTVIQLMRGITDLLNCLSNVPLAQGACGAAQATSATSDTLEQVTQKIDRYFVRWLCGAVQCTFHEEVMRLVPGLSNLDNVFNDLIQKGIGATNNPNIELDDGAGFGGSNEPTARGTPTFSVRSEREAFDIDAYQKDKRDNKLPDGTDTKEGRREAYTNTVAMNTQVALPNFELFDQRFIRSHWVISTVFLCIPGIIDHFIRQAEIKCRYIQCMEQDVRINGAPPQFCAMTEDYEKCVANNEIWATMLPFDDFMNSIGMLFGQLGFMFTGNGSPVATLQAWANMGVFVGSIACAFTCKSCVCGGGCALCTVLGMYQTVQRVVGAIQGWVQNPKGTFWYEPTYCTDELLNPEEDDSDDDDSSPELDEDEEAEL